MMGIYVHHVGLPLLLRKFLLWTPTLLVCAVGVGTLVGVMFIGRSIAAPTATAMGILLTYAGLVPLQELLIAQGNGASRTGHLTLLSPAVLLKNALGFTLVAASVPLTTGRTWLCAVTILVAAFATAAWVYLRAQGVETWEATPAQRRALTAVLVVVALLPVVAADTNYEQPAPRPNAAPPLRGVFGRSPSSLALVRGGGMLPARCCSAVLNREDAPLATDTRTDRDLLIVLPIETTSRIRDPQVHVTGEGGLELALRADEHTETRLEPHEYAADAGPLTADGRRLSSAWTLRVPVTLNPTHPWDIGGDRYPLTVSVTYRVDDEQMPRTATVHAAIDAQVAGAVYEMAAASSMLPLACLVAAVVRWRHTR